MAQEVVSYIKLFTERDEVKESYFLDTKKQVK